MKRNPSSFVGPLSLAFLLTACVGPQTGGPSAQSSELPPNYETPETEFVQANFNTLSSEFRDEYAGRYVVIDGRFIHTYEGALITTPSGRYVNLRDMMSAMIGPDGAGGRPLSVLWSKEDREMGRPFLNVERNGRVKIFGYVLPANRTARAKSRGDLHLKGFPVPVVLLIKAVPGV